MVTASRAFAGGNSATPVSAVINGLSQGTTIHYRVKAANAVSSAQSGDASFVVPASSNNLLASLRLANDTTITDLLSFTPAFDPAVTQYTFDQPSTRTAFFIAPVAQDPGATITIDGSDLVAANPPYVVVFPAEGLSEINVVVTAKKGDTRTYKITNRRLGTPALTTTAGGATAITKTSAALAASIIPRGRVITALYFQYQANSSSSAPAESTWTSALTVPVTPADPGSDYTLSTPVSASISSLGQNTKYWYRLVAEYNGTSTKSTAQSFTTANNDDANLVDLRTSGGTLSPAFSANTTSYTVTLPTGTTSIFVRPTKSDLNATVRVNGTVVATASNSASITVANGTNISVVVTALNATTKTYTLTVAVTPPVPTLGSMLGTTAGITISSGTPSYAAVAQQPDGKLLLGGTISYTVSGQARSHLLRLNEDGSLDTAFCLASTSPAAAVQTICLLPDGRFLIGGANYLRRYLPDGTLDPTFTPLALNGAVNSIHVGADGKIMISGAFSFADTTSRLNADGTLDNSFVRVNLTRNVWGMNLQPDGKALIVGEFRREFPVPYDQATSFYRYNTDGTLDPTFSQGLGHEDMRGVTLLGNGKMLVCGRNLGGGGPGLSFRNANGTLDTTIGAYGTNNAATSSVVMMQDRRVLMAGAHTTALSGRAAIPPAAMAVTVQAWMRSPWYTDPQTPRRSRRRWRRWATSSRERSTPWAWPHRSALNTGWIPPTAATSRRCRPRWAASTPRRLTRICWACWRQTRCTITASRRSVLAAPAMARTKR